MAEHAEGLTPAVFTKWCPKPGPMTMAVVEAAIDLSCQRLGVETIDLLQFHWWQYEHPAYLDALRHLDALRARGRIRHLALTNFDAAHLRVVLSSGIKIVSNQVCYGCLDMRAAGEMTALCAEHGVKLICFGVLAGGFLSDKWVGLPEPAVDDINDWSKMKYKRFVDIIGGWDRLQALLSALHAVGAKHGASVANVAVRYIMQQPAVAAVIVGARLGQSSHIQENLAVFGFSLDESDRAQIGAAIGGLTPVPGDCGDEYRKPPFLTATGDLSDHLESLPQVFSATPTPRGARVRAPPLAAVVTQRFLAAAFPSRHGCVCQFHLVGLRLHTDTAACCRWTPGRRGRTWQGSAGRCALGISSRSAAPRRRTRTAAWWRRGTRGRRRHTPSTRRSPPSPRSA